MYSYNSQIVHYIYIYIYGTGSPVSGSLLQQCIMALSYRESVDMRTEGETRHAAGRKMVPTTWTATWTKDDVN